MTDQIKIFRKASFFLLAAFIIMMSSCSKDEPEISDIESLVDRTVESMQQGAIGKNACLEFVFPISIQFVDATTASAESYEALHTLVSAWFEENGVEKSRANKPQLLFPIQVLTEDGEVADVESKDALKTLRNDCPGSKGCKGKNGKGFKCFSLVYPVALTIDGVDATFDDRQSLKTAVKAYKETAGDDAVKPTLVFPVTVQYDDESEVIAESQEALAALKQACRDEE